VKLPVVQMPQASLANFFGAKRKAAVATENAKVEVVADSDEEAVVKRRRLEDGGAGQVATPQRSAADHLHANSAAATPIKEPLTCSKPLPALPQGEHDWLPLAEDMKGRLPPAWEALLGGELRQAYFTSLRRFLFQEAFCKNAQIFPPSEEVFSAFHACDPSTVRVVIIGQDPYHDVGQAHGLAFSVKPGVSPLPPSLRNMLQEVAKDEALPTSAPPTHGCLTHWAQQGVLLLNTCLTVQAHQANSHQKQGWEKFTDAVVRVLNQRCSGLVFLLWGLPAQKKGACVSKAKHSVIKTSHPSPLSALRASSGNPAFIGSKCFSRCNEELARYKKGPPIDWSIPR